MGHQSIPPVTHDWDALDQLVTFDTFLAKAKLWLAGEGVDPSHQYIKITLMLGNTRLKRW